MRRSARRLLFSAALAGLLAPCATRADSQYDVVIYGATSGGISAAVEAARLGKSVALIEPTDRIGGMTTNGLSFTDTGNPSAIGGLARDFYTQVGQAYGQSTPSWNFEPKVALNVFQNWVRTPGITLVTGQQLSLNGGVTMQGNQIQSIRMESGLTFKGSMFIDAGYEGDLMAGAGVSYSVGREANFVYGETYNGVQRGIGGHQFSSATPVDPYKTPGDPSSGLLPGINPTAPGPNGSGDSNVQAYTYRLTLTQAANRQAWAAPANYDPANYELLRRYIAANGITSVNGKLLKISSIGHGKFDLNNQGPVSTDYIGGTNAYPNGSYTTRAQTAQAARNWEQGLLYFLANDPTLPASIRTEMNSYGLTTDEFTNNGGWSDQLYVREGRRMVGQYVMIDNNVLAKTKVTDSIGLGSYTMDSHNVQRFVDSSGHVQNEGDVEVGVSKPYPISYGSITPLASQASNLLVTSAMSASHIAYGSIRMEPVFMELGQAGGAAAALALDEKTSVQGIDYSALRTQLIHDSALLDWPNNIILGHLTAKVDFNDVSNTPTGFRYSNSGSGFAASWDGTGTENVVAGDLTYTRGGYALKQSAGSGAKLQGAYNAPRQNTRALGASLNGDVWFSLLVNNPTADSHVGLSLNPSTNGDPAAGPIEELLLLNGSSLQFQLSGTTLQAATQSLAVGQTHLILGHLVAGAGNDTLSIWADPSDLSNLSTPDLLINNQDLMDALSNVGLLSYNPTSTAGGYLDALAISNQPDAFAQVTGTPEPGALSLLGACAAGLLLRRRR